MSLGDEFEWDRAKADANLRKHGVSFGEAATAFADPLALDRLDPDHSAEEERAICMGRSYVDRLLVVAYTVREGHIRIIHARLAAPRERREYESRERR